MGNKRNHQLLDSPRRLPFAISAFSLFQRETDVTLSIHYQYLVTMLLANANEPATIYRPTEFLTTANVL